MNQKQCSLLMYINQVSFAMDDVNLFLDTHPCNKEAMEYYHMVKEQREKAMKEYNQKFGPLQIDQVESCDYWTWVEQAWPWE